MQTNKMKHAYRFDEHTHEYWDNKIKLLSVNQILDKCGYEFKGKPGHNTERGRYAHQTIELWERGILKEDTLDPVLKQYLELYKSKKNELKFEVLENELKMYSKQYPIAGATDLVLLLGGIKTICDIKTGIPNPKRDRLQTAGYMMLYNELNKKEPALQRLMLYINIDSNSVKQEVLTDNTDVEIFRACVKLAFYKLS